MLLGGGTCNKHFNVQKLKEYRNKGEAAGLPIFSKQRRESSLRVWPKSASEADEHPDCIIPATTHHDEQMLELEEHQRKKSV